MSSSKKITVRSSDGEIFELEEAVAVQAKSIRHMMEDGCADDIIPLPNVTGAVLAKVIEYCNKHVESDSKDVQDVGALCVWDSDFVKIDQDALLELILAANYLEVKSLLDLGCKAVADMIRGKTPEQIRKIFNIENDFTPEEEEEIRRENQWAFED